MVETPRLAQLVCEVPSLTLTGGGYLFSYLQTSIKHHKANIPTVDDGNPADRLGCIKTL